MANLKYTDAVVGTVFNEDGGAAIDLRVEGDTDANLLFVDASTDRVGIGTNTPSVKFDVLGNALITGNSSLDGTLTVNETGADRDTRIEGDTDANLFFVDASADAIGIGTNAPTSFLHLKASTTAKSSLRVPVGTSPTSPNEGDIYNDSTFKHLMAFIDGIKQGVNGTIFRQTQSVTVNTTNAETTLVGTGEGTVTLPADFLTVGKTIRVTAGGWYGTTGTPTNAVRLKYGTTTILQTSGDALSAGIGNDRMWRMQAEFTCRSVGATGTVIGEGMLAYWNGGSTNRPFAMQTLTTITINTTTSNAIGLTTQFSVSDVANTMTCALLVVEVL